MNNLQRDDTGAFAHIAAELRVPTGGVHMRVYNQEPETEKAGGRRHHPLKPYCSQAVSTADIAALEPS